MVLPWSLCQKSMGLVFVGLAAESLLFTILLYPSAMASRPRRPWLCRMSSVRGGGCESYSAHLFQDGFSFPGPWHFPVDLEPTSRFHKEACWGSDGTVPRGLWIPLRGPVS